MQDKMKEYWEKSHVENNRCMLTGSKFNDVWNSLNIINKLSSNIQILNIGVGFGYETIELSKLNVVVDVLDISEAALNRVKNITRNQYLVDNITSLPLNEYDVVVSHLVTQHMLDIDLNVQLKYVIRSLKDGGVFAMQFASIDHNQQNYDALRQYSITLRGDPTIDYGANFQSIENQKMGFVLRSVLEIEDMVKINGGYLDWVSNVRVFGHTPIKWYYIHIKKQK